MKNVMKKVLIATILIPLLVLSCKKEKKVDEPSLVLQRWTKSINDLNYKNYSRCEAYPKDRAVFKEMYKHYYLVDLMTIEVGRPAKKDIRKDHNGNSFIQRPVSFEATSVKRSSKKPYQLIRGDVTFIKFLDGKRKKDGWLISNRTLLRIDK